MSKMVSELLSGGLDELGAGPFGSAFLSLAVCMLKCCQELCVTFEPWMPVSGCCGTSRLLSPE